MYECNIYSNPERYKLKIWGTLDEEDLSYEFDMVVIWEHEDGRLLYKQDSGCSCPSPFESVDNIEQLEPLTAENYEQFISTYKDYNDKNRHELFLRIREHFAK